MTPSEKEDECEVGANDWDCVLVLPTEPEDTAPDDSYFRKLLSRLANAGLVCSCYYSVQGDEVYVKVRIPEDRLLRHADALNFDMKLDEEKLEETMATGFPEDGIGPISIGTEYKGRPISRFRPCQYIHGKYDTSGGLRQLYQVPRGGGSSPFRSMHRIKLITDVIQTSRRFAGADVPIPKRILQGSLLAYIPLHEPVERSALQKKWMSASSLSPPYDDLKNYFGEALGLYARFLGFITRQLFYVGVPGLLLNVAMWAIGYDEGPVPGILRAVYAAGLVIWSPLMARNWHREQTLIAMKWGTSEFERKEPLRPQFKGEVISSPVDGVEEIYFPPEKRRKRVLRGTLIAFLVVVADLVFVFALLRWKMTAASTTVPSLVQAIGIQVFAFVYKSIAVKITEVENWRTETQFQDSLTIRLFSFNFVNSYFSLLVIIFSNSKKICGGKDNDPCVVRLEVDLLLIFVIAYLTNIAQSVGIPFLMRYYNQFKEGGLKQTLSVAEWQYLLLEYDESLDSIQSYMTLLINLGYVLLFSAASPVVAIMMAAFSAVLLKLEMYKYLTGYRRIEPRGAQDIGRFETILQILYLVAPITSVAIVINKSAPFDAIQPLALRRYVYTITAALCIVVMLVIRAAVPESDEDVELQYRRQLFIREKIIDRVADEEEKIEVDVQKPDFNVSEKDDDDQYIETMKEVLHPAGPKKRHEERADDDV